MRRVLDTNVVLSGLLWRSHPGRLLDLAKEEAISLHTSSAPRDELADMLSREKWTAMLATRQTDAAYLMQRYGVLAKVVRPKRIGCVVPNDPDDDAVIACALAARADLIVSGDKHLLGLGGQYQGISIVTPAQAIQLVDR